MHITLQTRMLLARTQSLCETHRALLDELQVTYQQFRMSRLAVLCTRDKLRKTRRQNNRRRRQLSVLSPKLQAKADWDARSATGGSTTASRYADAKSKEGFLP
jgi:hypothetical protein